MKSCTEEDMQNMKTCTDLLYTFVMDQNNLMLTTSVGTAILTPAVAVSPSSQKSVNCTKSLILEQLVATMSANQHQKQCLSDSLRFGGKRVEFRP